VQSVTLGADNRTVTLTLAAPLAGASTLTVTGVRDLSPQGNVVAPGTTRPIDITRPIFALKDIQTFDGKGNGFQKTDVADLPAKGTDPWTINLFVYTDTQPGELTLLGGFGDGSDSDGQERYIIEYKKGIEFWGSNVDIASGLPFDLGKWQMVTATFDGQTVRLYKNGVEIKSGAATLSDAQPVVKLAPSGPWDNGHKFSGKIQDFTIWNRVLDPAFLHALLASGPQ
jgi:alpha-mannosidase